jgi:hypothetical protein
MLLELLPKRMSPTLKFCRKAHVTCRRSAARRRMSHVAEAVPSLLPVDFDKYKFSKILASSVSLRHCALVPTHRPHSLQTLELLLTKPLPPGCCG